LFFNTEYKAGYTKYAAFIKANTNPPIATFARYAFSNHFTGNYDEAIKYYNLVLEKKPQPAIESCTVFTDGNDLFYER
jgi:hypothetical protein